MVVGAATMNFSSFKGATVFLERLLAAINDLFANFWLIVIILLPFVLILGWIIQWFGS